MELSHLFLWCNYISSNNLYQGVIFPAFIPRCVKVYRIQYELASLQVVGVRSCYSFWIFILLSIFVSLGVKIYKLISFVLEMS